MTLQTHPAKLHNEYFTENRFPHKKLDYVSDVISMFKVDHTIAFQGISARLRN